MVLFGIGRWGVRERTGGKARWMVQTRQSLARAGADGGKARWMVQTRQSLARAVDGSNEAKPRSSGSGRGQSPSSIKSVDSLACCKSANLLEYVIVHEAI
jgi:hypothetical protein